jgi:tetratricopeptide (TPR) repeat protein
MSSTWVQLVQLGIHGLTIFFQTDSPYMMVADIHHNKLKGQEGASGQSHSVGNTRYPSTGYLPSPRIKLGQRYRVLWDLVLRFHSAPLGELPPPPPGKCFGRGNWFIEKVTKLIENLEPIALIGQGGIGKTSIALAVLHHNRICERFGENRRFIRCDQFPASRAHFLARLSKVIGAGVGDAEDLTHLRPFLSSKELLIVLDNAESVLDPQTTDAREIYSVVEELCQFKTICLLITSRTTTVPPCCRRPEIPKLSTGDAHNIFRRIYDDCSRSSGSSKFWNCFPIPYPLSGTTTYLRPLGPPFSTITDFLQQLDCHPLSITLLAATASHNRWDPDQVAEKWNTQRMQALQTDYNGGLAATIEICLSSPTFCSLGPNARDLLGVIAFFPQGIDERNLDWLFPTTPNREDIFDKFCVLSLTYRSNGFTTMLAPIRDYLVPRDAQSFPLLCATKNHYFSRLSVDVDPSNPRFKETQWISSEDVNVEHLFDVFTSIGPNTGDLLDTWCHFLRHMNWHKPRRTMLRPRIEALLDDYHLKPKYLSELSRLFGRVGNYMEQTRLLTHTLEHEGWSGNDLRVAQALLNLSDVNRLRGLHEEGIRQVKEALEIYERRGRVGGQAQCLNQLTWLLFDAKQLDTAKNAASRAIDLATETSQEFLLCQLHRILGKIHQSKGGKTKAIHHFETALGIASPPNWRDELFWIHYSMAELFSNEDEFGSANTHIEQAKSHAIDDAYRLGRAMDMQANVSFLQLRIEDAKSEALHALEIYKTCGAAYDAGVSRDFLQIIERAMEF